MSDMPHLGAPPLATVWGGALRRSLVWVIALTVLGAVAGGVAGLMSNKTYQAMTQLMLMPIDGGSTDLNNSTNVAQSLVSTYAQAAMSSQVLAAALADAHSTQSPSSLMSNTTAIVPSGTVVINLSVKDTSAQEAAALANAIAEEFVKQSPSLMPKLTTGTVIIKPTVLRPAQVPESASSLGPPVLVPVGGFLGFAGGLAVALWRRRGQKQ